MWSEWLTRTLKPRPAEDAAMPRGRRLRPALPELEADGMHPGADDFRSAVVKADADEPVA